MKYFSSIQKNTESGFTLVELLVAIAVFVVLATFSLGSVLGILDAGRKAKSLNSVMTNLNFTMEVLSREIRFGNSYHCGDASPFTLSNPPLAQDCTGNIVAASNAFSFITNNGLPTVYKLDTVKKQILKSSDGGTTYIGVTAPEVVIQDLKFYVFNSTPQSAPSPDNAQPRVIVLIRGYAGTKPTTQSSFVLQATLSQRPLDRSVTPTSLPVYDPFTYTFCANENGTCNFSGTATVAYGAAGLYNYQTGVVNTIACTNGVFGDPIVGTAKSCYYKITTPVQVAYRYVKWVITKKKTAGNDCGQGNGCMQAADLVLLQNGTPVSWPSGTVATNPSGSNPGPEGPSNAIDGNVNTKWLDFNFAGPDQQNGSSQLSIDVGSGNSVTFNGYRWSTANDATARDPISWVISGSNDGVTWTVLDTKSDQTITDTRQTYTSDYSF